MQASFDAFVRAYENDDHFPHRRYCEAYSFFDALGSIEGQSVLDLGCGAGLYTRRFKPRGAARVVGLDISPNMLDYARAREAEERQGIEYVLEDASDAGRLGPFDIVTAVYLLPYAVTREQLRAMCQGAYDSLKPGGRFVTMPMNPGARFAPRDFYQRYGLNIFPASPEHTGGGHLPDGAPIRLISQLLGKPIDVTAYYWSRETHEWALKEAGFKAIGWRPVKISSEGVGQFGEDHWRDFLENPPSVPLVCVK